MVRKSTEEGDVSIAVFRLGLNDEMGWLVAGSRRTYLPDASEKLLLDAAVDQASIGLQKAWIFGEQRRVARELAPPEEEVCKSPEATRRTMKRICTLATVLFLGTAYAGQIEGIKEAENVPTAFSQMHALALLALLVDLLFLNKYIESGGLAPHSAWTDRSPDSAMEEIERVRQS